MPKKQTPYFLFQAEIREEVKNDLQKAAGDGKVTTAEIGKEVGRRWGLLSDDEKAKYKERCEKINAEAAEAGDDGEGDGQGGRKGKAGGVAGTVPMALLKKLVSADESIKRVSPAAYTVCGKTVDFFIQNITERCVEVARKAKRVTIKPEDLLSIVMTDKKGDGPLFFLHEAMTTEIMPKIKEAEGSKPARAKGGKKREAEDDDDDEEEKPAKKKKDVREMLKGKKKEESEPESESEEEEEDDEE